MNERTKKLRGESLETVPSISCERAELMTEFYKNNHGMFSVPVMRALAFQHLCQHKSLWLGDDELIVGERGPAPKATPTYPELTCHSLEDLRILNSREKTWYRVSEQVVEAYEKTVIPYWRGRTLRDRLFKLLPQQWQNSYDAGVFTEFMEQRAPGHTVLDDKIYGKGMVDFKADIAVSRENLDYATDTQALRKAEQLQAMDIVCDALMLYADRYAELAESSARSAQTEQRRTELLEIAEVCRQVPAHAPRTLREALQYYWFCHIGVISELNGWDAFNPGHLDQHLLPFYRQEIADGTLTPNDARELLECFFIKFNNHPAPPKVGVTAAESGTYTDFANINLGGLLHDGSDGSNEITHLLLDIIDDMHLLQPSSNLQLSRKTPNAVLDHTLRVVRHGYGFPSIFNADAVVEEQIRQGKTFADARAGGCSGCVEVGAFGKEAYILTGYFNLVKILELSLHDGFDPGTGKQLGPKTGVAGDFVTFDELFAAFTEQLEYQVDIKIRGNQIIEQLYATDMPAPFLSVLIDDCITTGRDYNEGGARYNNSFIQAVGIGSITDSLAAIKRMVFDERALNLEEFVAILGNNFADQEALRQRLLHRMPKYGNDNEDADDLMVRVFEAGFSAIDGRPNSKGGVYRIEMLPTTCHIYFGSVCGATPDGRHAGKPLSEGISPVQGADRNGPTAVLKSASKMDHVRTGGTLLNMKFTPGLLAGDDGIKRLGQLVRSYFKMDGHHLQFNVVTAEQLREAQAAPDEYRDLIVRVAGYSDYFCDLSEALQEEIITRTEHKGF